MSDAWRNARAIEELQKEVASLRKLILSTVEVMKEARIGTTVKTAPVAAKPEVKEQKKNAKWF